MWPNLKMQFEPFFNYKTFRSPSKKALMLSPNDGAFICRYVKGSPGTIHLRPSPIMLYAMLSPITCSVKNRLLFGLQLQDLQ